MTNDTKPAFNLIDEPWIPVRTCGGELREISLTDALLNAGDYATLAETSPPNLIALYRLLLAVLHRALATHFDAWRDADRARWFREGLPEEPIRVYLEKWRERFWLFHPQHPFMQVAALAEAEETRDKYKSWTQIALESANGNTPVMFDHALDDAPTSIPFALACRNLLGFLQFTPGGLVKVLKTSDNAGALANTAAVLPLGQTLAQTLVLGLHPWDAQRLDDLPAWEQPAPTIAQLCANPTLATGPNDRYTRMSRAVLLISADASSGIRHALFAVGLALAHDPNFPDPMASFRVNKEGKAVRISFDEGRAVWRDLPVLVPDASGKFSVPPAVLSYAANLFAYLGRWDMPISVLTAGVANEVGQMKLLRWRAERIELPQTMLIDPDAAAELRQQIGFAEGVYFRMRAIAAEMVASTMPDPKHKDTKARAKAILENGPVAAIFFPSCERTLPKLMQQIAVGDIGAAHHGWMVTLKNAAVQAWEAIHKSLGDSPAVMRAEARAYPKFMGLLHSLEQPETVSNQEEATP